MFKKICLILSIITSISTVSANKVVALESVPTLNKVSEINLNNEIESLTNSSDLYNFLELSNGNYVSLIKVGTDYFKMTLYDKSFSILKEFEFKATRDILIKEFNGEIVTIRFELPTNSSYWTTYMTKFDYDLKVSK